MIQVIDSNGNLKNVVISSTTIGSAINAVSAGTAAITSGTIVFSNSNGVSFGVDGQTITASFSGGGGGAGAAISAGANSQNTGTVIFSNSNGLTFGLNAGTLTASHNGLTSQSNQAFSAQGGSSAFQTLSFNNANGITFSNNAGAIEASYTVPSTAGLLSNIRLSAGSTSNLLSAVTFNNSNGVSFGLDNGTITATVKTDYLTTARASNDAIGLNTAQSNVTWTVNSNGLSLDARGYAGTDTTVGATNLSASATLNSNGLQLSLSAAAPSAASVNFSAGTTSNNLESVVFNNSNGVSFGLNNGTITATVKTDYLTTAMQSGASTQFVQANAAFAGTNASGTIASSGISVSVANASNSSWTVSDAVTSMTVGRLAFTNSNGITMTLSTSNNGNATLFASHNGLTSQSNQAISGSNGSFAFQTVTFGNLNGLSFYSSNGSMVGSYTVPSTAGLLSAINVSAGTTSANTSAVTFANSNGISFGYDGGTITASHNGLTTAMASNASTQFVQANAAFAGTNASGTIASSGISISVNAAGGASNLSITGGNGSSLGSVSQMYFSNANSMTFGLSTSNNGSVTITGSFQPTVTEGLISFVNFSASNTSKDLVNVYFSNANGVSFGLDTLNNAITASVVGGASTFWGLNHYNDLQLVAGQVGQGTLQFDPVRVDGYVQMDRFCIPMVNTNSSNSSGSHTLSYWVGLYTRNSNTLSLFQSTSSTTAITHSGTAGSYSLFSGFRLFTIPFTTTITPNDYWIGFVSRTTSGGANGSYSNMLATNIATNYVGIFGASNNTTQQLTIGQGVYTATTSGMPGSVAFTQIRGSDSAALRPPAIIMAYSTV